MRRDDVTGFVAQGMQTASNESWRLGALLERSAADGYRLFGVARKSECLSGWRKIDGRQPVAGV
jgi:hypothetical protein